MRSSNFNRQGEFGGSDQDPNEGELYEQLMYAEGYEGEQMPNTDGLMNPFPDSGTHLTQRKLFVTSKTPHGLGL